MTVDLESLHASVAIARLENAALKATYMASRGYVSDEAWAYAITHSIYPWVHSDEPHNEYASAFLINADQVHAVVNALVSGRITSSIGVEEILGPDVPNVKIVAGKVLRYLYLSGFQPTDNAPLSELTLTSDAGFAFDNFNFKEIDVI